MHLSLDEYLIGSGKDLRHLPSSMMAVVTFLPVTPCAQAASTFKSRRGLPPFWPVFFYISRENLARQNARLEGNRKLPETGFQCVGVYYQTPKLINSNVRVIRNYLSKPKFQRLELSSTRFEQSTPKSHLNLNLLEQVPTWLKSSINSPRQQLTNNFR